MNLTKRLRAISSLVTALILASAIGWAGIATPPQAQAQAGSGPRVVELLATTTLTASGTGSAVRGFADASILKYQVVCASVTGTTPSYTFKLEDTLDGSNWNTLGTATAITAAGSQSITYAEVHASSAQVFTDTLRTSWTVTGTTPSASCRALVWAE